MMPLGHLQERLTSLAKQAKAISARVLTMEEPAEDPEFKRWLDDIWNLLGSEFFGQWPANEFHAITFAEHNNAFDNFYATEFDSGAAAREAQEHFRSGMTRTYALFAALLKDLPNVPRGGRPGVAPPPSSSPSTVINLQMPSGAAMQDTVDKKQAARFQVLAAAYKVTDGESGVEFEDERIAETLGLDFNRLDPLVDYLVAEGFLSRPGFGRILEITHGGVREYESAIATPAVRTSAFFPAVQVITNHVGQMVNSSIQQGTVGSTQTLTITQREGAEIVDILPKLMEFAAGLASDVPRQTLEAQIATIKAQLASPAPTRSILRESLVTARSIVEKAGGAVLASEIVKLLAGTQGV